MVELVGDENQPTAPEIFPGGSCRGGVPSSRAAVGQPLPHRSIRTSSPWGPPRPGL